MTETTCHVLGNQKNVFNVNSKAQKTKSFLNCNLTSLTNPSPNIQFMFLSTYFFFFRNFLHELAIKCLHMAPLIDSII